MAYTSQTKVELLISTNGNDRILEDLSSSEQTTFWTDLLQEVDSIVNLYLCDLYEASDLTGNNFVEESAKWIAAHLLTLRRGDPGYYHDRYDEILDRFQAIRDGSMKIPDNDGTPLVGSSANSPAIANMMVDDKFYTAPIRADTFTSAGEQSPNQNYSYERWFNW